MVLTRSSGGQWKGDKSLRALSSFCISRKVGS